MTTRLIGTDSNNPWLPDIVKVHADQARVDDLAGNFTATDVEGVLAELVDLVDDIVITGGSMPAASDAETIAGTITTKAVTPASLKYERPYFDVRTYGAVGDGVANDTPAINAAITAAAGRTIYFPAGTYNLAPSGAGLLAPPTAGSSFIGEGASDTVIVFAPTTTVARNCITIAADDVIFQNLTLRRASTFDSVMFQLSAGVDRFTLRDCVLDGGDDLFPIGYTQGIQLPESGTVTRIRAERCRFTNFHYPLLMTNTSTATVTDIQFRDCEFTAWVGEGLGFNAPVGTQRDVIVDGCRFVNPGAYRALTLAHVENARITDCYFNVGHEAVHIEDYCRDVTVANNTFYESGGAGQALDLMDSQYIAIVGNVFRNSTLLTAGKVVQIHGATSGNTVGGRPVLNATYAVTVSDNTVYAGPNTGIFVIHVAQVAVVGNTVIGDVAISSSFVETGTNALNGIMMTVSAQLGARITGNSIRGFRVGIGPPAFNVGSYQAATTIADNSVTECRYGIVGNNTRTAVYAANIVHRCIWPFTVTPAMPVTSGNDPHTIVGNVFQGNKYPAAYDGVIPVVANGTATVGSGVTLTVQPLIGDIVNSKVITFTGGGILTTSAGAAVNATSVTGNLTVANIASGEVGYIVAGVDIPNSGTFNVSNRSVWANVDSIRDVYTSNRTAFYKTAPIAVPTVTGAKGSNAALGSLITALKAFGLIVDTTTA
jgi:hypothetical protein